MSNRSECKYTREREDEKQELIFWWICEQRNHAFWSLSTEKTIVHYFKIGKSTQGTKVLTYSSFVGIKMHGYGVWYIIPPVNLPSTLLCVLCKQLFDYEIAKHFQRSQMSSRICERILQENKNKLRKRIVFRQFKLKPDFYFKKKTSCHSNVTNKN